MIRGFRRPDTRLLFETGRNRRFSAITTVATRKLAQLDAAETLEFLGSSPGIRLEALKGGTEGAVQHPRQRSVSRVLSLDRPGSARRGTRRLPLKVRQMFKNGMRPIHPGEILREDFLKPLGMSANALARALDVPFRRPGSMKSSASGAESAPIRPYVWHDISVAMHARSWLNLQTAYDLRSAEITSAKHIAREISPAVA